MSRILLILTGFPVAVALTGVAAEGDWGAAATPRAADPTLVLNESAYFRQHLVFGLERLSAKVLKDEGEKLFPKAGRGGRPGETPGSTGGNEDARPGTASRRCLRGRRGEREQ